MPTQNRVIKLINCLDPKGGGIRGLQILMNRFEDLTPSPPPSSDGFFSRKSPARKFFTPYKKSSDEKKTRKKFRRDRHRRHPLPKSSLKSEVHGSHPLSQASKMFKIFLSWQKFLQIFFHKKS